eukprot:UN28064
MIGRQTDCDIQVCHNSVSRYHAVIQHGKDGIYIYDCASTHGTFVNDHSPNLANDGKLPAKQYKQLFAQDIIMFG